MPGGGFDLCGQKKEGRTKCLGGMGVFCLLGKSWRKALACLLSADITRWRTLLMFSSIRNCILPTGTEDSPYILTSHLRCTCIKRRSRNGISFLSAGIRRLHHPPLSQPANGKKTKHPYFNVHPSHIRNVQRLWVLRLYREHPSQIQNIPFPFRRFQIIPCFDRTSRFRRNCFQATSSSPFAASYLILAETPVSEPVPPRLQVR
jgi:hypothetical protein